MANNLIQIKRSSSTSTPTTTLNAGELAYSYASNSFFIGAQTGIGATALKIGGSKYGYLDNAGNPGVQTANAVVILDSNSFNSSVYTQGLVIQTTSSGTITAPLINSVSSFANSSVIGSNTSGGGTGNEIVTSASIVTYVAGRTGAAVGANGNFLFNNSGINTGASNFNYDYITGAITVGNSSVNVQLGYVTGGGQQLQHWHGNANNYAQVQLTNSNTGPSSSADYIINADNYTDTTNYVDLGINGSGWSNTTWTINGADDGYLYAANGTMAIGTASAKSIQFFANGTLATNEVMRIDAGANVGIGNTNPNAKLQVTGTANVSGAMYIGGSTTLAANLVLSGNTIQTNGTIGTAGQVLASGGSTGTVYWSSAAATVAGSTTQMQYNDGGTLAGAAGFTFAKATNNVTLANTLFLGTNATVNNTLFQVTNSTSTANLSAANLVIGTAYVNSTAVGPSSNVFLSTTQLVVGTNTTVNTNISGTQVQVANSTTIANLTSIALTIGATSVNTSGVNSTSFSANSTVVNAASLYVQTNTVTIGTGSYFVSNGNVGIGNSAPTDKLRVEGALTANSLIVNNALSAANLTSSTNTVTIGTAAFHVSNGNFGIGNSAPADKLSVNGSTTLGGSVSITGANVDMTSSLLRVRDATISGNLTVQGTLTTIDTTSLQVKDPMIKLADSEASTTTFTDVYDIGFYGSFGNTGTTLYSGFYRDHSGSSNTNPLYKIFASNTEPTTIVDNTATAYTIGSLQAYLLPYGLSGAFVANSLAVTITANSTVNVNFTANSLTLTTGLVAGSGGTGQTSYTIGDVLYASGTTALSKLGIGSNGQVLQVTNNLPAYGSLDGGAF